MTMAVFTLYVFETDSDTGLECLATAYQGTLAQLSRFVLYHHTGAECRLVWSRAR